MFQVPKYQSANPLDQFRIKYIYVDYITRDDRQLLVCDRPNRNVLFKVNKIRFYHRFL